MFLLTDQLRNDVQSRDALIQELTIERDQYRKEAKKFRHDFDKQSKQLKEQEEILEQCQERIASLMIKNDSTTTELKWKLEELTRANQTLEDEASSLRNKVQSLQVELDNSEVVQRDFVKLSQSLQIQLEKIRQADSEVRWQHEDDVSDCNQCGKKLNSRKDKVRTIDK
jgi:Rab GTPase-binding effector protein 1